MFLTPLKHKVNRGIFGGTKFAPVEIVVASLENDAGIYSAAALTFIKIKNMIDGNKIKLLILWDILQKNTDENHAMNTDEIIAELAKRDIPATRKVIPSDIATLNAYGYEVLTYKKKFHYYYVV